MSQQYKLPLTGKQVEEKLENTILTPITASVGQTVKISAVDANGKPTAWEAVDFSEGGTTSTYTNQLPLATDTDRITVYDDNGYIDGYRLSSSGGISAQDGMSATGFIPATPGQTIRIKGATPMQGKNNYIIAYKADNTVSKYASMAYDSTGWITPHDGWMKYENGVIIILLTSTMFGSDFNAVRFCFAQLSDDVIVTVDEKIVDAIPTITTASVGQTIKVSAIDENGRPAAWEATPIGLHKIIDYTTEEETLNATTAKVEFLSDIDGNPIAMKNCLIKICGTVINDVDNDYHLRIGFSKKDSRHWKSFTIPAKNTNVALFLIASIDEQGRISIDEGSSKHVINTGVGTIKATIIDKIEIFSNNTNKTHLAAGAHIVVWEVT